MSSLKTADQSELLRLKHEQITTIDQIKQHDGSMKDKIVRVAQIYEQRINLLDPELTFAINQISTQIKRELEGYPVATFLEQYLPDKYKDPRLSAFGKLAHHIQEYGSQVELGQPIEQCSNDDLYRLFGANEDYDNVLDTEVKRTTNRKDTILEEMFKRGLKLDGYKLRNPISAHDFHYEIPATLEGLNKALIDKIGEIIKRWGGKPTIPHSGIMGRVEEWPPTNYDDSKKYYLALSVYEQILGSEDLKMSGSWDRWCRRGYTEISGSKHGAGNSQKLPTILCAWCSRNVDEDPTDYEIMFPDQESPTGWRCLKCKGVNTLTRYTTREQVGDRKDYVQAFASNVMNNLPDLGDFYLHYIEHYIERIENSRKRVIASQFSDSAIGGTSTKIIKKAK